MGRILQDHTLHIINQDKTGDKLKGVMIQVDDTESVFHVGDAKHCSVPPVIVAVENILQPKYMNEVFTWAQIKQAIKEASGQ